MNIPFKTELLCVGKKKTLGSDNKTFFYTVGITTADGDAGNLSCTEEVYEGVEPLQKYMFSCVYRDGQYKGLRVVGFAPEGFYVDGSSASAPAEPVKKETAKKGKDI